MQLEEEPGRNHVEAAGLRVVRGASWYSATVAVLSKTYRETLQPEVRAPRFILAYGIRSST